MLSLEDARAEVKRARESLNRREDELVRLSRRFGAGDLGLMMGSSDEVQQRNLLAADISNQRVIDQLNGQVL